MAEGSAAVLKRMMNHAVAADVTLGHYVAKCDVQLHVTTKVRAMIGFLVEALQVRAWAE